MIAKEKANLQKSINEQKTSLMTSISEKILEDNKKKYHVGKIVMSTENVSPATYLGFGNWTLWGAGKVPVGVDSSDNDFKDAEQTGGEKTHKLTVAEMPAHLHNQRVANGQGRLEWGYSFSYAGHNAAVNNGAIEKTGGDQAHNNMQPYITCYMWKRIS